MSWRIHYFGGKTLQNNWRKCVENIKVPIKSITNYILNYIKLLRIPKVFKHPTNFEPRNSPFKASIKAIFKVSVEGWDSVALRQAISRRSMHASVCAVHFSCLLPLESPKISITSPSHKTFWTICSWLPSFPMEFSLNKLNILTPSTLFHYYVKKPCHLPVNAKYHPTWSLKRQTGPGFSAPTYLVREAIVYQHLWAVIIHAGDLSCLIRTHLLKSCVAKKQSWLLGKVRLCWFFSPLFCFIFCISSKSAVVLNIYSFYLFRY